MGKIYLVFLILILITAIGAFFLGILSWRRHPVQGARMLAALLFAISWWGIFNALEGFTRDLALKTLWVRFEYLGILFVAPLFLGFILQYTRRGHWLQRRFIIPVVAVACIFVGVVWTNPWHHLFDQEFALTTDYGFSMLAVRHGPLFWVHLTYTYLLLLFALWLLIRTIQLSLTIHRREQGMILLALLTPWGANAITILWRGAIPPVDLTPLAFSVTGALLYLAVYRLHLLDITPIARKMVMENIQDGVLVVDHDSRALDANPVALSWLGLTFKQVIGKPVAELIPNLKGPPTADGEGLAHQELETHFQGKPRVLGVSTSPIFDARSDRIGWVLLLRDETERIENESALKNALEINQSIITDLKQLEQDLEEAKALLEQAFAQSPVPMVLLRSPAGTIEMMNSACKESFRIANPDDLLGAPFGEATFAWQFCDLEGNAMPPAQSPFQEALSGATLHNQEYQIRYSDGSTGWGLVNASPVWNKYDQQIAALLVFVDITERKQIEESEREQRILAETYRDTAATLNSAIQMDTVLTLILANIERVVPHDASHLIIFNEAGEISRTRFRGYPADEQQLALHACIRATGAPDWLPLSDPPSPDAGYPSAPVMVNDVTRMPWPDGQPVFEQLRSFLHVPIWFKGGILGVLSLASKTPGFFTAVHAGRLQVFADQAAIAIENSRLYAEMQYLTLTDELTRVYNYRGLLELGEREFDRARRFNRPLALLFFDVDHFRDFNNRYSHAVGNQVLQSLTKTVRGCLRGVDLLARFGGEEFVVILPETDLEHAIRVAERMRQEAEKAVVLTRFGRLNITISVGVAQLDEDMPSLAALIDRANQAEQRAKRGGRNQVSVMPQADPI